jgi:hypothetical protein
VETTSVTGLEGEFPLYYVEYDGREREFALVESSIRIGIFVYPAWPDAPFEVLMSQTRRAGDCQSGKNGH